MNNDGYSVHTPAFSCSVVGCEFMTDRSDEIIAHEEWHDGEWDAMNLSDDDGRAVIDIPDEYFELGGES